MLVISAYSLLLLKTVPTPEGSRSYFSVQLVSIIIGYVGAIVLTIIDYRSIAKSMVFYRCNIHYSDFIYLIFRSGRYG